MGAILSGMIFMAFDMVMLVRQSLGEVASSAKGAIGRAPGDLIFSCLARSRSLSRSVGIGISTGQTSWQAPQRVDALGRSAYL